MEKRDFEQFCELWTATCEMCNGKKPSEMVTSLAFDDLQAFTIKEVFDALKKHRLHPDTGKYWPQSQTIMASIKGTGDLVSAQAWQKVYHALRCISYSEDIRFDDPIIMQTVQDMGGWQILLDTDDETIGYKENDFKKTYRAYTISGLKSPPPEVFRGSENLQRLNAGAELKNFPSYEQKMLLSKNREEVKTLPRPIDAIMEDLSKDSTDPNYAITQMKQLLGMVE